MEMTRGMKWASEGCYKALRALVDAASADNNRSFLFRNCEEHAAIIEKAELALSYYDHHGYNGVYNNAMLSMATAILNLHAIPRHGQADTRVNVGKVAAGTGRNIICDSAHMEMEVRGIRLR